MQVAEHLELIEVVVKKGTESKTLRSAFDTITDDDTNKICEEICNIMNISENISMKCTFVEYKSLYTFVITTRGIQSIRARYAPEPLINASFVLSKDNSYISKINIFRNTENTLDSETMFCMFLNYIISNN